jgi:hypothetical protein
VSKLDSSFKEHAGNLLRRSSMTSNDMAKEMMKGEFESSLCLLDKNFSPSFKV